MLYKLDDKLPLQKNIIYGLQHLIYMVVSAIAMPIVVGPLIGLEQSEIAVVMQTTFIVGGVMAILQVKFGHGYPLVEAPAGLWTGIMSIIAGLVANAGKDLAVLRTDLEGGMMIAGVVVVLLSVTGAIPLLTKLFNPAVNSVLIFLMTLQVSPSLVKGVLGIDKDNLIADYRSAVIGIAIIIIILAINLFAKGFLQSISVMIGILVGWIMSVYLGLTHSLSFTGKGFLSLPQLFAWGKPTFDPGITITCVIAALVLLSLTYTSVKNMSEVMKEQVTSNKLKKSFFLHGLTTLSAGVFPMIPFMPYLSSIGFVTMTGVAARMPFILGAILLIILGLLPTVGLLFATIPATVGCGATIVIFSLIMAQGVRELQKIRMSSRESFVIGIPMLVGIGTMFLPANALQGLPDTAEYFLSNGLVVGIFLALILDNVLPGKSLKVC